MQHHSRWWSDPFTAVCFVEVDLSRIKEALEEIVRHEPGVSLSSIPAKLKEMLVQLLPRGMKLKQVLNMCPEVRRFLSYVDQIVTSKEFEIRNDALHPSAQ